MAPAAATDLELDLMDQLATLHEQAADTLRAIIAGHTRHEIARSQGVSDTTVRRNLQGARAHLKRVLHLPPKERFPTVTPCAAPLASGIGKSAREDPKAS